MPPTPASRSRGFTLLELVVVIALIAIIAALAFSVLTAIRQRNAVSLAPQQLAAAMETARDEALATGRDTLLVLIGNNGPGDAYRCLGRMSGGLDVVTLGTGSNVASCVRYWILEDMPGAPFDVSSFDPAAAPTRRGQTTAQNDVVLGYDVLPGSIYIGKHPGYTVPSVNAGSIFASLSPLLGSDCSFCAPGIGAPRGVIRFNPRGEVRLGSSTTPGGVVFLSAADAAGTPVSDTRLVAILSPVGVVTTRIAATQ